MLEGALEVGKVFSNKSLLFTGTTGFVGKVVLALLLERYGQALEKIYILVRRGNSVSAERRFYDRVLPSEPFQPLRDLLGEDGALQLVESKCVILDGDITDPALGLSETQLSALEGQVSLLINCAGLVSFNPPLEVSLNVNTHGVRNVADTALRLKVPLVHMSTAFVAGNRSGLVFEDDEVKGYFPRKGNGSEPDFSLDSELSDITRAVARLKESADSNIQTSLFRQKAHERLAAEGRDVSDEKILRLAMGRERKLWLNSEAVRLGMERASHWGWPNTYTYTKSLGEQVIASTPGLSWAIVRPSIVESALRFPFPGWNEGFTTSAPLAFAGLQRPGNLPAGDKTILDIIPVDQVASAVVAIAAQTLAAPSQKVYHLASGDLNPLWASRSVELVGLYRRRHYRKKRSEGGLKNELLSRLEPQPVSEAVFGATSAPLLARGASLLKDTLSTLRPSWGAPRVDALLTQATGRLDEVSAEARSLLALVDLFLPFLWQNRYVFRCDNTRELFARLSEEDRARLSWAPEQIDWRTYFLDVHLPGLEKWVFPGLEEKRLEKKAVPAHRDLLELFEAAVHAYRHRVAFRMVEKETETRFTFGEVHRFSGRVASFLARTGVAPNDCVLLLSENRPEWGITYFGILRAGATAVPVDAALSEGEVVNLAKRCGARACLLSEQAAQALPGLFQALHAAGLSTQVHSLAQAMAFEKNAPALPRASSAPDARASIIFTSGTTGTPRGVMLTHRNFTSLVAKLAKSFNMGPGDGLLSVLPLHHTFEFSSGFLLPFSRGAEVTYVDELTGDRLGQVFEDGRITSMVGVPAVWQLFHRKMTLELSSRPRFVERLFQGLLSAHSEFRHRTDVNLGPWLFWPFHRKFGGRLKLMVSGGSALPEEVQETFFALGLPLTQGYGLTEAAPVLTVAPLSNARPKGSVGRALPGIELRILEPDAEGVGEVLAKGPNVMAGYYEDAEATDGVLQDGWLHTQDLGRLDADGNLFLVGRKKDVIIDANGKNVYPDELEALYAPHPAIRELSMVGLPDDSSGEKVACLCVPMEKGPEARQQIEQHFREVSAKLPFYRRVKVLRFSDTALPRTSTRKVKRRQVVEDLLRREKLSQSAEKALQAGVLSEGLIQLLSEVSGRPAREILPQSTLAGDLGFDSLMLTELASALENAQVSPRLLDNLGQLETVDDLRKLLATQPFSTPTARKAASTSTQDATELEVPEAIARLGRSVLSLGQKALYQTLFDVKVTGAQHIPRNRNFLVVANHQSHLDMGLIKQALGEEGDRLTALAAKDYFFDTPLKRAYFENFTQLIPMERQGSLRESLRLATEALHQGYHLLIFPEGTRSPDGRMQEFKPTLGFLARSAEVDVLPMYLEGAFEALPKGALLPKERKLEVRIGPVLKWEALRGATQGMARSESYRHITRLCEDAIKALRDGKGDAALVSAPGNPGDSKRHGAGEP